MTERADRYAKDWLSMARIAQACDRSRQPWPAWSMGQLLAVSLLLQDNDRLADLGYSEADALERLRYDLGLPDVVTAAQWFADLRGRG